MVQAAQSVGQPGLGARSWVLGVSQPVAAFKTNRSMVRGSWVLEPGPLLYPRELSAVSFLGHVSGAETVKEPATPLFWVGAGCWGEEQT